MALNKLTDGPEKPAEKAVVIPPVSPLAALRDAKVGLQSGINITIHGPPGHGKTRCAAMASKGWGTKEKVLDDQLWIMFDHHGLAGLVAEGYTIPYVIDVPLLIKEGKNGRPLNALQALAIVYTTMYAAIAAYPGIRIVIGDTISALDDMLVKYWDENCPETKGGKRNTMEMWTCLRNSHTQFFDVLTSVDKYIIFLAHPKTVDEEHANAIQLAKIQSVSTPGKANLIPQITGQSLGLYTKHTSLEMSLLAIPGAGLSKTSTRKLFSHANAGYRGKNRFQGIIPDEMDADLGKVIELIEGAVKIK